MQRLWKRFPSWVRRRRKRPSSRASKSRGVLPWRMEMLEPRQLLAADIYVNDNWQFVTDNGAQGVLDVGDIVTNANDANNPGTITKTYGVDAFGTVTTGALTGTASGAATIQNALAAASGASDTVHLLEGTYAAGDTLNLGTTSHLIAVDAGEAIVNGAISSTTASGQFSKEGSGTLTLAGSGAGYSGATTIDAGVLKITNAAALGSGAIAINGGTLDVEASGFSVGNLTLATGGTLAGASDTTVTGTMSWTGGTMSGTGKTVIGSAATLNISTSAHSLSRNLKIDGTTNWTAGAITFAGGTVTDNGSFTVDSAVAISTVDGGGTNGFTVSSTGTLVKKSAGKLTFAANIPFNAAGAVDVQGGTLDISGGGAISNTLQVRSGAGLIFNAGYTYSAGRAFDGRRNGHVQRRDAHACGRAIQSDGGCEFQQWDRPRSPTRSRPARWAR